MPPLAREAPALEPFIPSMASVGTDGPYAPGFSGGRTLWYLPPQVPRGQQKIQSQQKNDEIIDLTQE